MRMVIFEYIEHIFDKLYGSEEIFLNAMSDSTTQT